MKNLIGFLITFSLLIILGLGYLGFIPYLSSYIGPKPKDLGIRFSQKAYDDGYKKSGVKRDAISQPATVKNSLVLIDSHQVKDNFTSEEVTAASQQRKWINWPFQQVQIRFNQDGTGEASGTIKISKIFNYLATLGVSSSDVEKAVEKFKIPKIDLTFYIKISGSVTDNKVNCNISRLELGRIPIPMNYITKYTPAVNWFLENNLIRNRPGYELSSLSIKNSQLYFNGKLPDIEATVDE